MGRRVIIAICIICLSACSKDEGEPGIPSELMEYHGVRVNTPEGNFLCDDLVKSAGAPKALGLCLEQAKNGNMHAKARLGVIYSNGSLGDRDWEHAMNWFLLAAKQGHVEAQYIVGQSFEKGRGVEQNASEAYKWYSQAAKSGFLKAKTSIGLCYLYGKGVSQNTSEAIKWLSKAAEQNSPQAQFELGNLMLRQAKNLEHIRLAEKWLIVSAKQNYPKALIALGDLYRKPKFREADMNQAAFWYERAISQKSKEAQHHVATLILRGKWRQQYDPIFLLDLSATKGYKPAQLEIARQYMQGINVVGSEKLAFQWFLRAANGAMAEPEAQYHLARFYIQGVEDQPPSVKQGLHYLKKAAKHDYYPAKYLLAILHLEGHKVLKDKFQVIDYLSQAANQGIADAQLKLAKVLAEFAIPKYDKAAFYWAEKAAAREGLESQYTLGTYYYEGIGTPVDYKKAFEYFSHLSYEHHALSELKLGQMFYYGQGVDKNIGLATKYFIKSARQGEAEAKSWVTILFKEDFDSIENLNDARALLDFMVELNDIDALYLKGVSHLFGKYAFEQNTDMGFQYLTQAADKNHPRAQRDLARLYEEGIFGVQDLQQASFWFKRAARNGDPFSKNKLNQSLSASIMENE